MSNIPGAYKPGKSGDDDSATDPFALGRKLQQEAGMPGGAAMPLT